MALDWHVDATDEPDLVTPDTPPPVDETVGSEDADSGGATQASYQSRITQTTSSPSLKDLSTGVLF